ncbi:uncharacterized protein LOC112351677 isoform X1 [Selaginella moellendorffii]|uniref:uncharacterized protein LOC112351677 isoform X1 n=1 Tax=Selaginella moellendorffii TaxID=88036 RepID=UPI000D1CBFE8|nr:uncharacterized protein LOC112351677 isoform X1 [Selaginella moellendorffii]|eukprot:XP_024545749.1 uncharacterized protein LOC112351677 isoform X1 [Selaginella moellendorffii]
MGGQAAPVIIESRKDQSHPKEAAAEEAAKRRSGGGSAGGGISEATRDAARARLLVLSEAGDDAELLEKVSEANTPTASTPRSPASTPAEVQNGDVKDACCRSKLMAIADTLPPDPLASTTH